MSNFTEDLDKAIYNLHDKGAFLTVKSGENINTMTIGWGSIGYQWGKPIFMVLVRKTRYTYNLIENSQDFTVTIPLSDNLKEELRFCGTKSGRDIDKLKACNLQIKDSNKVYSPIINKRDVLTYECKIVYKQEMDNRLISPDVKEVYYKDNDYHVIYYGEIVDCYKI